MADLIEAPADAQRDQAPLFATHGLPGGLLAAIGVALIGAVAWYLIGAFIPFDTGFLAAAVGWVIGTGAVAGARGGGSAWLAGASAILTVLALATGEYLVSHHLGTQLGEVRDLIQPPAAMLDVVARVLTDDPATLGLWGIAVIIAAYVPIRAIKPAGAVAAAPD